MRSFSDPFSVSPKSFCGWGWDIFASSPGSQETRCLNSEQGHMVEIVPWVLLLHMELHKKGRDLEPWEKNSDASSIRPWWSIPSSEAPYVHSWPTSCRLMLIGRNWFDLRSTVFHPLATFQLKTMGLSASSRHKLIWCLFHSTTISRNGCLILNSLNPC